jgi:hypothetical protein
MYVQAVWLSLCRCGAAECICAGAAHAVVAVQARLEHNSHKPMCRGNETASCSRI